MITFDYYLTSLEPDLDQSIYSQSIGGFCSNSRLYLKTTLAQNLGLYGTSLYIDAPSDGWSGWSDVSYYYINNEMFHISSLDQTTGQVVISSRAANNILEMHVADDVVRGVNGELFNDVFSSSNTQYRCIAVKNTTTDNNPSTYLSAENISVYLKQNSRNSDVNIEIAVEVPQSQYLTGASGSRTTLSLTDTMLINLYEDNYFAECFLKPQGETGGIVRSFDSSTGTFVFYSSFSASTDNKPYELFPAPAQRIKTGTQEPSIQTNMSSFSECPPESPLQLNDIATDSGGLILAPNDLFYIWIKRTINKGASASSANDFVIDVSYNATS